MLDGAGMTRLASLLLLFALAACVDEPITDGIELEAIGNQPITVSPGKVNFGTRKVGTLTSATVTLTNNSTVSFQCNLITSNNAAFTLSSTWIHALVPGESLPLTVTFAPTKAGSYAGTVAILADDGTVPGEFAVAGLAK